MFKKSNPQQNLFTVDTQLTDGLQTRLKSSWAKLFKDEVLPILLKNEEKFSLLYGKTGRPNYSVDRVLGLCLLQELNDLSDQDALDTFGFDIRWRYALDVSEEKAYLSRRSLVEFRRRLTGKDPEMNLIRDIFEDISKAAIKKLGLSVNDQRVDSTLILSNIRTRGRLDLFSNTINLFLKSLDQKRFKRVPAAIQKWHEEEPDGWFGLGKTERKTKLKQVAHWAHRLIAIFAYDKEVKNSESYLLLVRHFHEQCEVKNKKVKLKKKTKGKSLQSAFDPDASYGHKGMGYSAHITETCNNKDKKEIITDYEVHGAHRSDKGKAADIIDRLESVELKPKKLFADGGYPTVSTSLRIRENDVEFIAPVDRSRLGDHVMGRDQFEFDPEVFLIKCPKGHKPIDHRILSSNNTKARGLFAILDGDLCRKCKVLDRCPVRAPNHRTRGCKPRDTIGNFRLEITQGLRLRDEMYSIQQTDEWKGHYKIRSGIEATMSELKRRHGIGKLRVRRLSKVCFSVACKVIACNIKRWAEAYAHTVDDFRGSYLSIIHLLSNFWHYFEDLFTSMEVKKYKLI